MKKTKRKEAMVLVAVICFLCSLFVGLFCLFDVNQKAAFADAEISSSLRFTLYNDNSEYKVAAKDKKLTEAIIPSYYNGLPVTEVADNAFMSCTLLEKVKIPETVKRVGNNAFANCSTLKKLVGMVNVTEIGNNAFAMCSQLNNLIIPPKLQKLGSSIIRNVTNPVYVRSTQEAIQALNINWNLNSTAQIIYGNDLVCEEVFGEDGSIIGFSINYGQGLMPDIDYVLLCSYKYRECNGGQCLDTECTNEHSETYYPIINIDDSAFMFTEFNSLTIKYDDEHISYRYPVNVCSSAFSCVFADSINIEVDITFNDDNYDSETYPDVENGSSMNVFAGSTVTSITLPDSLDKIPRSTFSLCSNLKYIYSTNPYIGANTLSDKIVAVDSSAFEYCTSLELLNIPNVQYIGNAVFDQWGSTETQQTINIDLYKPDDLWDKNWTGDLLDNVTINFNTMAVVFEKQEGVGGSNNIEVTYGQPMPEATAPERVGYYFDGYYSSPKGNGDKYYNGDMDCVRNWDKVSNPTILYANWIPKKYIVKLADGVEIEATYYEEMPEAPVPEVDRGHHFSGYLGPDGTKYYNADMSSAHIWDIAEDNIELSLMTTPNDYKVILADEEEVIVTFGKEMPEASVPEVDKGYHFSGYLGPDGTKYYNADMSSAHVWDIAEDNVRLELFLEPNEYTVFLQNGGQIKAIYGCPMPDAEKPYVEGRIFEGYSYNGIFYYDSDMNSVRDWDIDDNDVTLLFESSEFFTYISYDLDGGNNNPANPDIVYYSKYIVLKIAEKQGYKFAGWYLNDEKITNLYHRTEEYIVLKAKYTPITYYVNYYANLPVSGASYSGTTARTTHTYDMDGNLANNGFNAVSFNFAGWATEPNGEIKYSNGANVKNLTSTNEANIHLYAKWVEKSLNNCYNNGLYEIATLNQLEQLSVYGVNNWTFKLVCNLTADNWTAVPEFNGTFNLNNYTIKYNKQIAAAEHYGFILINNGTIKNGTFVPEIKASNEKVSASDMVVYLIGGVCAQNKGNVENIVVKSARGRGSEVFNNNTRDVDINIPGYLHLCGGIVGDNVGTIANCTNYASIGGEIMQCGGISGRSTTLITECTNYGNLYVAIDVGLQTVSFGGIVGVVFEIDCKILKCINGGNVVYAAFTASSASVIRMAQIAGFAHTIVEISECSCYGRVYCNQAYYNGNYVTNGEVGEWYDKKYGEDDSGNSGNCVAPGTLITLASGEQVAVENLKTGDKLLVWNLFTGTFDVAPIILIDSDPAKVYEVINLYFSDGTTVKVMSEHAFWDYDLNKYVYLRKDAAQYIGHWFNKHTTNSEGEFVNEKVKLINVEVKNEFTTAWSPVTYGHLCYYVNGMLSMPGGITGLFNIFEVDCEKMQYDNISMNKDIETYGLFTYGEFAEIYPISEEMFNAFNGQYLKISIGKGLITMEDIGELINRYAEFLS